MSIKFDYAAIRDEVREVLDEFGFGLTVQRLKSSNDVVAGKATKTIEQEQILKAVILPASGENITAFDVRVLEGVNASSDVRLCVMSASGAAFVPQHNDEVEYYDGRWQVMGCTPLNVNGTAIIYSVGLRRP